MFFLTTKAEVDAEMRKKAPLMFAFGAFMILMQFAAATAISFGIVFPTCSDSHQCQRGSYCFVHAGASSGRCQYCGQAAPLVPYWSTAGAIQQSDIDRYPKIKQGPTGTEKLWNRIGSESYPSKGFFSGRASEPIFFAGFNLTQVADRCAPGVGGAFQEFEYTAHWLPQWCEFGSPRDPSCTMVEASGNIPVGIEPARRPPTEQPRFSSQSVRSWCDTCVFGDGDVDIWNENVMADTNVSAMAMLDWITLVVCAYVVGLTIVGEIKCADLAFACVVHQLRRILTD